MAAALTARDVPGFQEVGALVGEHGHQAVEHGDVDEFALAGFLDVVECSEDADDRVEARGQVADGDAGAHGASLLLTGQAHAAGECLDDHVVGGQVLVRASLAEAGDGGPDQ